MLRGLLESELIQTQQKASHVCLAMLQARCDALDAQVASVDNQIYFYQFPLIGFQCTYLEIPLQSTFQANLNTSEVF